MKTTIYYFTGTGNNMAIAKKIGEKLGNTDVVSIPNIIHDEKPITGDVIGIVCPIYMYDMPYMVADFITKIKNAAYIFFVYAGGGELGGGDKAALKRFTALGLKCSALFNIPMPSNYSPFGATPPAKRDAYLKDAETKTDQIVDIINARKEHIDHNDTGFFATHIHPGIWYKIGYSQVPKLAGNFSVDEKCNGCGICQKVCPVNNIELKDEKPVWDAHCQQCYACLQWCPQESVQSGKASVGVERYHHPEVKVKDIIAASPVKES